MDPDANLKEQREIRRRIKAGRATADDRARLRELVHALNTWIANGGFRPAAWSR